jgi:hypothetical protein
MVHPAGLLLVLDHVAADRREWRVLLHMLSVTLTTNVVSLPAVTLRVRDRVMAGLVVATIDYCLGWLKC